MSNHSDYVNYGELYDMVQAARRQLGLPEYKNNSSLAYQLRALNIPSRRYGKVKRKWHAPTAMRALCPAAAEPGTVWVTYCELMQHVNAERARLDLPPLSRINNKRLLYHGVHRVPYGKGYYLYPLQSSLHASIFYGKYTEHTRHRLGTPEELASGEFLPVPEAARRLNCAVARLSHAASHYNVLAFRHPETNKIWVRVKDAERVAHYRTRNFLRRYLPADKVQEIVATRPFVEHRWFCQRIRHYYVPEYSHLGPGVTGCEPDRLA